MDKIKLDKRCFKIDRINASAMISGYEKNGKIIHQAIYLEVKRNPFPMLLSFFKKPPRFDLSPTGKKINIDSFSISHKYIAVLDSEYFIENDIRLWEILCNNGLFDIWQAEAPYKRFLNAKTNASQYRILLLRIYEIENEFKQDEVVVTSNHRVDHITKDNREITIKKPVINDKEFQRIKSLLINLIKPPDLAEQISAWQKEHLPGKRISERKKAELEVRDLLGFKAGKFQESDLNEFFSLINKDYHKGKAIHSRFSLAYIGNNAKQLVNQLDTVNEWIDQLWNTSETDLKDLLDKFYKDKIKYAGDAFPSLILYLRNPSKFNLCFPRMVKGLSTLQDFSNRSYSGDFYFEYNESANEFKKKYGLKPQELDVILSLMADPDPPGPIIPLVHMDTLNMILYGPPGTGKTYQTVNYALSIIENKSLDEINEEENSTGRSELLKRYKKYKDDGQIEFITFHQNYAYEDFIQGLRPNIKETDGSLSFKLNDGVFKLIADSALDNYKASRNIGEESSDKPSFRKVFDSYFEKLIDGEIDFIELKMKKASYKITGIGEKSINFEKQTGNADHTLSISTLSDMYEREEYTLTQKGGMRPYYVPLLQELLTHARSMSIDSTAEELKNYVIIIDEINRANISRVFGELITLIEDDKRYGQSSEMKATLPSGEPFIVPPNLYIIGTMNTADKSIALIDIALRRRFEFIKLYPEVKIVEEAYKELFNKINDQIVELKGPDFQIGHAYFMEKPDQEFKIESTMNKRVIPLLYEYFMNDGDTVNSILNEAGVKTVKKYGLWEFESYSNG